MRTLAIGFAIALSIAPQMVVASSAPTSVGPRNAEAAGSVAHSRYNLAPASGVEMKVAATPGQRKFTPESRVAHEADGVRFGDGVMQYFEGPSWDYQTSRRGPIFEVGALGGGMENAPYLAHVAMNWRF